VRATEAAERVVTARDSEIAKRQKTIEVLLAEKRAEETKIAADAERVRAAVEAEAQRLLNEAENVLTDQARYSLLDGAPLELAHHGQTISLSAGKPVTVAVPPPPARSSPRQPPGRGPARRQPARRAR